MNAERWTAAATVAIALATIASVVVTVLLMRAQDRITDIQNRLVELQRRNNWLTGALESHSSWTLRLRAEELKKRIIWWDPTHDGPEKKAPPNSAGHLKPVENGTVYFYLPPELRRFPDIT